MPINIRICIYTATIHHGIEIDRFAIHSSPSEHCCSSDESTRQGTATRSKSPARCGRRLDIAGSSRTRSTLTTRSHRTSKGTGCAHRAGRRICARQGTWSRARATSPHRLRRTVRIQRGRGDGLWYAGYRELERLDGRADFARCHRLSRRRHRFCVGRGRRCRRTYRPAIAALAAERFTVSAMVDKYVALYRDVIGDRGWI